MTTSTRQEWPYPGSRWWKFDFHTHTPASRDTWWAQNDEDLSPEAWLLRYMAAGIDCVAITDHNNGAWIDKLKTAYEQMKTQADTGSAPQEFRELTLFPGVELSVQGGFHLLAILDPEAGTGEIDTLLGQVDYDGTKGDSDGVTRKGAAETVNEVLEAGGIPIPAHADGPKGLLELREDDPQSLRLDANTVRQVLAEPGILAMEVVDRAKPKHTIYQESGLSWSEVLGSDCHNFRGSIVPGSRYTWVKMEKPSLDGLRLALLDGQGLSIRRSDDPEAFDAFAVPPNCIEAIEVTNARYMGRDQSTRLAFSPWLNALVGGRGTGKSTIIHALRLAASRGQELHQLDEYSTPRQTFERFEQVPENRTEAGGLTKDTAIRWTVTRDSVRHRVHWQDTGTATVVEEAAGDQRWKPSSLPPDRIPIRILSQGQIAELAGENQQALLQMIDEGAGVGVIKSRLEDARNAFLSLRARIREIDGKLARRNKIEVDRNDVERKLKRFEDSGHTSILTAYRIRNRQRREVDRHFDVTEAAAAQSEEAAAAFVPEDLPEGAFDQASDEDQQALASIGALANATREAGRTLRTAAHGLRGVVATQREALATSTWQAAVEAADREYEELVEALRVDGVPDLSEYGRLTSERQALDGELKVLNSLSETRTILLAQSTTQLERVLVARREVSAVRDAFLTETLANNRFVRIGLRRYGNDLRVIERSLRKALNVLDYRFERDILATDVDGRNRGCVADLLDDPLDDSTEDPKQDSSEPRSREVEDRIEALKNRLAAACAGEQPYGRSFSNYLAREFARSPGFLDKLLIWFPEDALQVKYSRSGEGTDFHPIDQASDGQRSAAMLAFLLARGDEPLVFDQPEDDLDNHLIYDLVVRQMQENKRRRQIIVVTHNPNIVVNGDAEMVYVLEFQGGQCRIKDSGSLQISSVREEVCQVMEGGREAFERRYRRLGREPFHV